MFVGRSDPSRRIECNMCDGYGRVDRRRACNGTGRCHACRGVGSIPNPKGFERCRACQGTGLINPGEPKSPSVPLVDKCEECGRQLQDEDPVCPHCGRARRKCLQCDALWVLGATWCAKCGFRPPE